MLKSLTKNGWAFDREVVHGSLGEGGAFDRDAFEQLLSAMARERLVELKEETFESDGREIAFRRVLFLQAPEDFVLLIKERPERKGRAKKKRAASKKAAARPTADLAVVEALRKWRMGAAKKEGVPPFRVLTDKALHGIAEERPRTVDELLEVAGVGPRIAARYGATILKALQQV